MPPKKTSTATKKDPEHPSYKDMIVSAISTVCSLSRTTLKLLISLSLCLCSMCLLPLYTMGMC